MTTTNTNAGTEVAEIIDADALIPTIAYPEGHPRIDNYDAIVETLDRMLAYVSNPETYVTDDDRKNAKRTRANVVKFQSHVKSEVRNTIDELAEVITKQGWAIEDQCEGIKRELDAVNNRFNREFKATRHQMVRDIIADKLNVEGDEELGAVHTLVFDSRWGNRSLTDADVTEQLEQRLDAIGGFAQLAPLALGEVDTSPIEAARRLVAHGWSLPSTLTKMKEERDYEEAQAREEQARVRDEATVDTAAEQVADEPATEGYVRLSVIVSADKVDNFKALCAGLPFVESVNES